jgi:hypothetical protein
MNLTAGALKKKLASPKSRYLVFTSAGDRANLQSWLKGKQNFDFWITYYGETKNRYREFCDYYLERKGGKFPNLHYAYQHFREILECYEAIFIMDDDLIISSTEIGYLFEIREKYDLWLLQPAYDPQGKISHPITGARPLSFMRYTNFVEVTCPLFRRDVLDKFMKIYDPILIGWGIDWLYMHALGDKIEKKVAVVDAVTCLNPTDEMKGGYREIELLQDTPTRIENWKKIRQLHNVRELLAADQYESGYEKFPLNFKYLASAIKHWRKVLLKNLAAGSKKHLTRLLVSLNRRGFKK